VPLATPGDKRSRVTTCFPCLGAATETTIVFEKRWYDRPSFRTEHRFRRTMGRPSIRSWTDPPFEANASIVRPDPTLLTKRFRTSQKRPPLYQAYGDGQKPTTVFEKRWDARPSLREMCRRGLVIGATRGLVASDGTRSRNAPDTFGRKSIPGTWRLSDLPFAGSTVQKS
jgi:hypothetical protein